MASVEWVFSGGAQQHNAHTLVATTVPRRRKKAMCFNSACRRHQETAQAESSRAYTGAYRTVPMVSAMQFRGLVVVWYMGLSWNTTRLKLLMWMMPSPCVRGIYLTKRNEEEGELGKRKRVRGGVGGGKGRRRDEGGRGGGTREKVRCCRAPSPCQAFSWQRLVMVAVVSFWNRQGPIL